jgi:drug/metabolite transporter (DMT)-like permease
MLAGVALGLGASLCWAVANVVIQRSSRRVGAFRALLWAQVVGMVIVAAVAPAVDERAAAFRGPDALWLLGAGAAALLGYVSLFYAFEHGRLTVVVPVMSSWSVIAAGLSLLLFADRVRPAQLAGAAAVVAGALVVSRAAQRESAGAEQGPRSRWLLAAAGTAVGFGLLIPMLGRLAPVAGSVGTVGVVYAVDILLGLPLARWGRVSLAPPPRDAWPALILAGLFETAGFTSIAIGARHAPLALVAPLAGLAPTFTVAYAWAVLRERPSPAVLAGAALACTGVVVLAL